MSHYGIILPQFWDGDTGRAIADAGGPASQVLALYLSANRAATMIGLYPLSLPVVHADIRSLSLRQITNGLGVLASTGFAQFDAATEMVWVREMAKYRLNLHLKPIEKGDNRLKHVHRLYEGCRANPFLSPFFDRYRRDLHLSKRRTFEAPSKPLRSPLRGDTQAPSKPVSVTETGTGTREQGQKIEQEDQNQPSADVLLKLAHTVMDDIDSGALESSAAKDEMKHRASKAGLMYAAGDINAALDLAERQRVRKRA